MSLNFTPSAERINIVFYGKTNAGKSSLVNAITNQKMSLVSEVKGTTTDPVCKAMELLPLGAVTITDTAGYDDKSILGNLRTEKTKDTLLKTDIAILVADAVSGLDNTDKEFIEMFKARNIKYIIAYNKVDLLKEIPQNTENEIYTSATKNINIYELKELISRIYKDYRKEEKLLPDCIKTGDTVILVTPIDEAAPKGRIILPQQQVIRSLLEKNAVTLIVQEPELQNAFKKLNEKPKLVITDSQAFKTVNELTDKDIMLTSFSILFAKYKGVLDIAVKSVVKLKNIQDGDKILISEGCTHHRQCNDIGSVKLPNMIKKYTQKMPEFEFSSGNDFPQDTSEYKMIIHCGSCMLKDKEVIERYNIALNNNVPITNYGITIAYINGILKRSIQIFPDLYNLL